MNFRHNAIHNRQILLALETADEMCREQFGAVAEGVHRAAGKVGDDRDIVKGKERAVRGEWFLVEHVQGGTHDFSRLQDFEQCLFVHQAAPGGVDKDGRWFHHLQEFAIDEVVCFRQVSGMD